MQQETSVQNLVGLREALSVKGKHPTRVTEKEKKEEGEEKEK
jgi:hypothetical protein